MFMPNEIRDPNSKPTRIHHPWSELEEYQPDGGMWSIPAAYDRPQFVADSSALMADPNRFYLSMIRATTEWPRSTENALTNPSLNHRAWIGHAGCYLATGSPEETTRLGWHELDEPEQYAANAAADRAIQKWRESHHLLLSAHRQPSLWGDDVA